MTPPVSGVASGPATAPVVALDAPPRAPLTPAPVPAAVLLPPVVASCAAAAAILAVDSLSRGTWDSAWTGAAFLRAFAVAFLAAGVVSLARTSLKAHGVPGSFAIAVVLATGVASLADRVLPGQGLHRSALVAAWGLCAVAPSLWTRWRTRWTRERSLCVSLLAPSDWAAYEALHRLEAVPWIRVASVLVPGCDPIVASRLTGRPVALAARGGPRLERRVVVSCPLRDEGVGRSIAELVARGHAITSESATLRAAEGRVDCSRADPLNLLLGRPRSRLADAASRAMDVVFSAILLVLAAPLFVVVSLAVLIDGGWPVFYRQHRVGRAGRTFSVLKFRSMRRDAESDTGPVWAQENDPRVTRVGRVLRHYRLDELPQLLNVLVGQMALVGPRPERPHFFEALRRDVPLFDLRTIVRPGITGWAQVRLAYGASSDDARAKLAYDLYYVTRRSPWLDLAILVETAGAVLSRRGSR